MDKLLAIINRKPLFFVIASVVYLFMIGFLHWGVNPTVDTVWFLAGGMLGIYFLDAAEEFFHLVPSPFRSIVFLGGFLVVSLFVVTSSDSLLAQGLVLSLYLTLLLWQVGQWRIQGNLHDWYRLVASPVSVNIQRWVLIGFAVLFVVETYMFIR